MDTGTQTGPLLVDGTTQLAAKEAWQAGLRLVAAAQPELAEAAPPVEVMVRDRREGDAGIWGAVPSEKDSISPLKW